MKISKQIFKMDNNGQPYLELSQNPVRFEAVNQMTNVFFDDSNRQVCIRFYHLFIPPSFYTPIDTPIFG